jgi:membrane-anchored protein YejM (alkaline phosphatase superfamily)
MMEVLVKRRDAIRDIIVDRVAAYRLVVAFLVLNVPLILLILMRDAGTEDLTWLSWFYVSNLAFGYYGLPLLAIVTAIFFLLVPVRRLAVAASGLAVVLFICFLFLDSYVYGIFKFHIDPFWMEFAVRDYDSLGVTRMTLIAVCAMLLGVAVVETGIFSLASRFATRKGLVRTFLALAVLAFAVSQTLHVVTYERNDRRITSLTPRLPAYMPVISHRHAEKYGDLLPLGDAGPERDDGDGAGAPMRYPLTALRFEAPRAEKPPNIVFLLIESWRADAFDEVTTPRMFAFGRRSSVCLNHLSSGNQTTCGLFGLFYGLHPTYWPAVKANSASIDNPVLIDVLKSRGYEFGIFAKSNFDRHKIAATMFNGIEIHETFSGRTIPEQDMDMADQLMKFMEEKALTGTPFMTLVFFKSSHAPYEYPSDRAIFGGTKNVGLALKKNTDPAPFLKDYRNSLHFVDSIAGAILDTLEALGELDRTIVVITTDHAESFNEQGSNFWGHGSNFTENQVHVPFVLHAPGRAPARIERRTSHIDLAPTLLEDYFGCASDASEYSNGRNLFDESRAPRPLVIGSYVSHAYVFGDDVYEIMLPYSRRYKLNDLRAEASPPPSDMLKTVMSETSRFLKH